LNLHNKNDQNSFNQSDDMKNFLKKNQPLPPKAPEREAALIWARISFDADVSQKSFFKLLPTSWITGLAATALAATMVVFFNLQPRPLVSEADIALFNESMELEYVAHDETNEGYDLAQLIVE
jgi:hypothetical protein